MLPVVMAERIGYDLGVDVWTYLYKLSSRHNTDAPASQRARTLHNWSGELPPRDAQIVLVDDTYTTGQTLVSLAAHVGVPPAAIVTISFGRYGKGWKADPAQISAFLDKAGITEDDFISFMEAPSDKPSLEHKSTNTGSTVPPVASGSSIASLPDHARAALARIKEMRAKGLLPRR